MLRAGGIGRPRRPLPPATLSFSGVPLLAALIYTDHMTDSIQPPAASSGAPTFRALIPDLIVDAALPAIAYQVLSRHGVSDLTALTAGAIFPAVNIMRKFVVTRRLDIIGAVVLTFIAIGTATSLLSGNVLFILIKESMITALFGLVCVSSLLWPRPLMFYFGRQFAAGEDPARLVWWNGLWDQRERFRTTLRMITTVWGVAFLIEAMVRVGFALTLTPGIVVMISPIMAIAVTVLLIIWTRNYARAAQQRGEREAALAATAPAT